MWDLILMPFNYCKKLLKKKLNHYSNRDYQTTKSSFKKNVMSTQIQLSQNENQRIGSKHVLVISLILPAGTEFLSLKIRNYNTSLTK